MLFCDLRTEVMSGPRRGDSMSQRKALREKPVRCGACSVGGLYRTAEMSTSSTGVMARREEPFVFPRPVELDPPMCNQPINQSASINGGQTGGVYALVGGVDKAGRRRRTTTMAGTASLCLVRLDRRTAPVEPVRPRHHAFSCFAFISF